jgi:hypothetical protein
MDEMAVPILKASSFCHTLGEGKFGRADDIWVEE